MRYVLLIISLCSKLRKVQGVHETPSRPDMLTAHMSLAPRVKKGEISSEAEALRRDPFKNYGVQPDDV
jgi:hypothetical protein